MRSIALLFALTACGTAADDEGSDTGSCEVPCQPSTAASGGGCQVNLYCTTTEPAVYCFDNGSGGWDCDCGPAVDSPPSFTSTTICDLDLDGRACEALAQCTNWVFD